MVENSTPESYAICLNQPTLPRASRVFQSSLHKPSPTSSTTDNRKSKVLSTLKPLWLLMDKKSPGAIVWWHNLSPWHRFCNCKWADMAAEKKPPDFSVFFLTHQEFVCWNRLTRTIFVGTGTDRFLIFSNEGSLWARLRLVPQIPRLTQTGDGCAVVTWQSRCNHLQLLWMVKKGRKIRCKITK